VYVFKAAQQAEVKLKKYFLSLLFTVTV